MVDAEQMDINDNVHSEASRTVYLGYQCRNTNTQIDIETVLDLFCSASGDTMSPVILRFRRAVTISIFMVVGMLGALY